MEKLLLRSFVCSVLLVFSFSGLLKAQYGRASKPLKVGYSTGINNITPEKMNYAKSVGIDCIETSFSAILEKKERKFKISHAEIIELVTKARKTAETAGIEIWSVHMPFGENIDLSLGDEKERQEVVALHKQLLEYCRILRPKVILFHPSWFLGLNEREIRKQQLARSVLELNKTVKDINAVMVIENMLGPELQLPGGKRERPLCRTVKETVEIMNSLPEDVYSAIDMNHIKNPELLVQAMGKRLRSVHIADGTGMEENHFSPCSGKGSNNWTEILSALQRASYKGPFMFESSYTDVKELKECYDSLYRSFLKAK